jgi:hypothetical protein
MNRRTFIEGLLGASVAANNRRLFRTGMPWIQVSPVNSNYFALSNGQPFVVMGLNLAWAADVQTMKGYLKKLSAGGGNFARVWLCHWPFEVERRFGVYNDDVIRNVDMLLGWAVESGIRIKFCLEDTRQIVADPHAQFNRPQYHVDNGGPFRNIDEYINTERGREVYLNRLTFLSNRYKNVPVIFGWELWNEMNGIRCDGLEDWNNYMLPKARALFPHHLVMQSLGSFDSKGRRKVYQQITGIKDNMVGQIHRYVDEGAELEVCKGPIDLLAADAINELRSYQLHKPLLLAETGAVKPHHAGPSECYAADKAGMMLHDMLFAPFFSGAAGTGNAWHWDEYVDKNDLWYHFDRFRKMIDGVDVVKERFQPECIDLGRLRLYVLQGRTTILIWCRDKLNDWRTECRNGISPETIRRAIVDCRRWIHGRQVAAASCYDPWLNRWATFPAAYRLQLPDFQRSIIIKINTK